MSLKDFLATLDQLEGEAAAAFDSATDAEALEEARVRYLGAKKGALKDVQKQMGGIDPGDRKDAGMRLNAFKANVQTAFEEAQSRLGGGDSSGIDPTFDPTLPGVQPSIGHIH
ncbi:MAG: phenylalanine--tRNA ligase subunit alpha, partial [Rubripirellula sp.]